MRRLEAALASGVEVPHAAGVLALPQGALDRDPRAQVDRRCLRDVLKTPVAELCARTPGRRRG